MNPDITGIRVRIAIYAQNILCFVPIVVHLKDGSTSDEEMKGIKDQLIGMLAVAFAILISTIIQAKAAIQGQPITGFHAAVILDLSWMNNTSTWVWFLLYAHHISNYALFSDTREQGHKATLYVVKVASLSRIITCFVPWHQRTRQQATPYVAKAASPLSRIYIRCMRTVDPHPPIFAPGVG
ncbi:hypothetical protein C8R46DRAFT_1268736 [Mycena filopes]|nr:hypothetical protein C8R46DRAFT_1268736 [Mycena filopes]